MLRAKHLPQLTSITNCLYIDHQNPTTKSTVDSRMDVGSSSSGTAPAKKAFKGSKIKTTKAKPNGIAKAKRTKPTKARDNRASQYDINLAMSSSSAAAQDDATEAMDYTPADDV